MQQSCLTIKDFSVVKDLGSGSFGKVQLVRKKTDQLLYAIKSVNMIRLNQKEKDSALNQVRLLASIHIPYVIGYKGAFFNTENQSLCVVMEYADGGDLQGKITQQFKNHNQQGFDETFIWKVAFQLFQGLKTLHQNKIIHRDIKSANVFFVNGIAKLGDLNVSKVVDSGFCSTQTGTPYYTSPQIWKGKKYGRKCDIWSTGCLLYEMCTLHPPFRAKDFPGLYRKVVVGNYQPIPSRYSPQLSELIRMCLTVDEDIRPQASQLLQTPILSGMQLSLQKFRKQQNQINLIDPIKCPRVLRFLNNKLPQSKFDGKIKKTVGFITKKQIQFNNSSQKQQQIKSPIKIYKKVKSQKIIHIFNQQQQSSNHHQFMLNNNKINIKQLSIQKKQLCDKQSPLKFSVKKIRIPNASEKKICFGSKKHIKIEEKQNSVKYVGDQNQNDQ